ncbi:MAG: radical SAM protein [Oscillospiraceae bacterium]|nr:radical SAM protein [Oscillospiraceae bacterium]
MGKYKRIDALKKAVLSQEVSAGLALELKANTDAEMFVVFLSVSNKRGRARVFNASAATLAGAWAGAERRADNYLTKRKKDKKPFGAVWVKADVVVSYEEINTVDLNKIVINERWRNYMRVGVSLTPDFKGDKTAFLESELNGNKMIAYYTESEFNSRAFEYDASLIVQDNLNTYRKRCYDLPPIDEIPERITIFTTRGFFCGEDDVVHELYADTLDAADFGRRRIDVVDGDIVRETIVQASEFLANEIQPDGAFIYGYFPVFDAQISGYNIVRHASSLWSLINLYRMSPPEKREKLMPKLSSAIAYMEREIEYKDDDTAFLVERNANEIKLGACGVAIIMYTEYLDVFADSADSETIAGYVETVRKLANGILQMQNAKTGEYWHILDFPGFERGNAENEFRTVYYDGEATFALARAYTYTKDERFLKAAKRSVDNFIVKNYVQHRDHWVAYALFEVTKYAPSPKYYEFALRNADENLNAIYSRATSFHTYLEMLMAAWRTYKRAIADGIKSTTIKKYDPTYFAQTIYRRARHMLNGVFYPEYAMYMKCPEKVVGSFMVRHHNYRVRIDDIQHFIGGYYFYSVFYDEIKEYLTEDFIRSLDKSVSVTLVDEESVTLRFVIDSQDIPPSPEPPMPTLPTQAETWLKIQQLGAACIGCGACMNICPNKAIVIHSTAEGDVAVVDKARCTKCRRCERICPIVKSQERLRARGGQVIASPDSNTLQFPQNREAIYYGIPDNLSGRIDSFIAKTSVPVAFTDHDVKFKNGKIKGKVLGKYDALEVEKALERYPNADVWILYSDPYNTANRMLRLLPQERIKFLNANMEYRLGCHFLGHFISYRMNTFSPCCVAGMNPVVQTSGSIPERIAHWQRYTTQLVDDIRNGKPNDCSKCPLLKPGFWRADVALDMVNFGSNNPGDVCNFKCIYCFSEGALEKLKGENEGFTTCEIIQQLSQMPEFDNNKFTIQLSNGEFCANKQCDEILDILLKTKWRIKLITNLSIYREKLGVLMKTGRVYSTVVSMDAGTRETFKTVKKLDSWNKVVANLKKYPVQKAGLTLKYIMLKGVNDNEADIDGFYDLVKNVGCKVIALSSNQKLKYEPLTPKMRELALRLATKAKADGVEITTTTYLNTDDAKWLRETYNKL